MCLNLLGYSMLFFLSLFQRQWFNILLGVLAVSALVLGVIGWSAEFDALQADPQIVSPEISDTLWWKLNYAGAHALRAFFFADMYASPWSSGFRWEIAVSGWLGSFVAVSALVKGALQVFSGSVARLQAETRKDHVVVIGRRKAALQACVALAEDKWQVTYHGDAGGELLTGVLVVGRPVDPDDRFLAKSVADADRVIIAEETDSQTSELALRMAKAAPDADIFAILNNPWLAADLRLSNFQGKSGDQSEDPLIAVSEIRALARTALVPSPPFLLAKRAGHARIHMLIYGFNSLAIALFEETLFANVTADQRLPRFTFLTRNAEAAKAEFEARHPNFKDETKRSLQGPVDIEFIECDASIVTVDAIKALRPIFEVDPVTAAYVTTDDQAEPLASGLALRAAATQHDLFDAPILVQSREGNGAATARGVDLNLVGLHAFGRWHDVIMALGVLDRRPDALARAYHENYRREVLNRHGAEERWEVLPEVFRIANRNAISHLPAKLDAVGFDITPYLEQLDALSPSTAPEVHPDDQLVACDEEKDRLTRLEHERWMVERWVNGWRCGDRSNPKRRHPNLVPFDELDAETQRLDAVFVDWVARWIEKDAKKGLKRAAKRS